MLRFLLLLVELCDQSSGVSAVPLKSDLPFTGLQAGEGVRSPQGSGYYFLRQLLTVPQVPPHVFSLLTAAPPAPGLSVASQKWPERFRGKRQLREGRISEKELSTVSRVSEVK